MEEEGKNPQKDQIIMEVSYSFIKDLKHFRHLGPVH